MHGVVVERDRESRDLLVRVLAGLDWNTGTFDALSDAEPYLSRAWGLFVSAELVGGPDKQTMRCLRRDAPDSVIVLTLPSSDAAQIGMFKDSGADVVLARPLAEVAVIDAVGKALIFRRS